jgi:hypothetical protein
MTPTRLLLKFEVPKVVTQNEGYCIRIFAHLYNMVWFIFCCPQDNVFFVILNFFNRLTFTNGAFLLTRTAINSISPP